jgi:hypothetical protein
MHFQRALVDICVIWRGWKSNILVVVLAWGIILDHTKILGPPLANWWWDYGMIHSNHADNILESGLPGRVIRHFFIMVLTVSLFRFLPYSFIFSFSLVKESWEFFTYVNIMKFMNIFLKTMYILKICENIFKILNNFYIHKHFFDSLAFFKSMNIF